MVAARLATLLAVAISNIRNVPVFITQGLIYTVGPLFMQIVKFLESIEVLPDDGDALDVGPKHFQDTFSLIKAGFKVTAIEPGDIPAEVEPFEKDGSLQVVNLKLEDSIIEHYDVIIAGNVLPFVDDPAEQLERLVGRLRKGGVMYFNEWGPRHAWAKDYPTVPQMKAIEYDLARWNLEIIHKKETEGLVPTYSHGPTWWHDYSFIVRYN